MRRSALSGSFKSPLARSTYAITLAALLTSPAAASESILSARTELSGLRFTLVDLAPDDGIDPWIRFITPNANLAPSTVIDAVGAVYSRNEDEFNEPVTPGRSFYTFSSETPVTSTQWLPAQSATVASLDGTATVTATSSSLASAVQMSEADILAHRYQVIPELNLAPGTWRADVVSTAEAGEAPPAMVSSVMDPATRTVTYVLKDPAPPRDLIAPRFEISAQTAVKFEGTLTFQGVIDLSHYTLDELQDTWVRVGSSVNLDIGPDAAASDQTQWSTYADAMESLNVQSILRSKSLQYRYFNNRGNYPPLTNSYADTEDFSITFTNDSAEAATGRVRASSYDLISVTGVQAIPEPSTWALMAIGLVGIAGLTARQRQVASTS